jgi:hypothetical protein
VSRSVAWSIPPIGALMTSTLEGAATDLPVTNAKVRRYTAAALVGPKVSVSRAVPRAYEALSRVKLPDRDEALLGDGEGDRPDARIATWKDAKAPRDPIADARVAQCRDHSRAACAARDRVEAALRPVDRDPNGFSANSDQMQPS